MSRCFTGLLPDMQRIETSRDEDGGTKEPMWRILRFRLKRADGVPWGIRTLDLLLRRQLLYPAELKAHIFVAVNTVPKSSG